MISDVIAASQEIAGLDGERAKGEKQYATGEVDKDKHEAPGNLGMLQGLACLGGT